MGYKRIAILLSFIAILIIPAFTREYFIDGVNSVRLALANLVFAIFFLSHRKITIANRLATPLLILLVYIFYKLFNASDALNYAELIYSSQLTFFFLSTLLLVSTLHAKNTSNTLIISVVIGNILSLLYLGYEVIEKGGIQAVSPYQLSSFFSYKNVLSACLLLFSVIGAYWAFHQKRSLKIAILFLVILNFLASYYLASRAVLLAYFCILFAFLFLAVKKPLLKSIIIAGSLLFISLLAFYIVNYTDLSISSLDSMEERLKLWNKSVQLIQEEFWLGVGAGNWQFNFSRFGVNDIYMLHQSKSSFQSPHNELLWIFSEGGFIGLSLITILIISMVVKNRTPKIKCETSYQKMLLSSALIGFLPVAFFSFPSERVAILFLYAMVLVLWFNSTSLKLQQLELPKHFKYAFVVLCIASSIIALYRMKGEYHLKKMILAQRAKKPQQVLKHAQKASSWFYTTDSRSTPIASYQGWAHERMGNDVQLLAAARKAFQLSPYDFEILSNLGSALIKNYRLDQAEVILLKSYELNIHHDPTKLNLSVLYYNQQQYWKALEWLREIPGYELEYPSLLTKIVNKLNFPSA